MFIPPFEIYVTAAGHRNGKAQVETKTIGIKSNVAHAMLLKEMLVCTLKTAKQQTNNQVYPHWTCQQCWHQHLQSNYTQQQQPIPCFGNYHPQPLGVAWNKHLNYTCNCRWSFVTSQLPKHPTSQQLAKHSMRTSKLQSTPWTTEPTQHRLFLSKIIPPPHPSKTTCMQHHQQAFLGRSTHPEPTRHNPSIASNLSQCKFCQQCWHISQMAGNYSNSPWPRSRHSMHPGNQHKLDDTNTMQCWMHYQPICLLCQQTLGIHKQHIYHHQNLSCPTLSTGKNANSSSEKMDSTNQWHRLWHIWIRCGHTYPCKEMKKKTSL